MALIPIIQKPIMKLMTTKKERAIKMKQLREVTKIEKIIFPILCTLIVGILLPDAIPLLGMLMLGKPDARVRRRRTPLVARRRTA